MTKKADKGLSSLFFLVVGLLTVILYNNLKEDWVLQEVTEDTPSEEIPVNGVICFIIDDFGLAPCAEAVNDYRKANNIDNQIIDVDGSGAYWRKE